MPARVAAAAPPAQGYPVADQPQVVGVVVLRFQELLLAARRCQPRWAGGPAAARWCPGEPRTSFRSRRRSYSCPATTRPLRRRTWANGPGNGSEAGRGPCLGRPLRGSRGALVPEKEVPMATGAIVAIVIVVIVVAAVLFVLTTANRRRRLRERFGPEYDRAVTERGSRREAEAELAERERHVRELDIRPLSPAARSQYQSEWTAVQEQFVDAPQAAVTGAQTLVSAVMEDRGYPTQPYDQTVADLSVEHASTLDHFRAAHDISQNAAAGTAIHRGPAPGDDPLPGALRRAPRGARQQPGRPGRWAGWRPGHRTRRGNGRGPVRARLHRPVRGRSSR